MKNQFFLLICFLGFFLSFQERGRSRAPESEWEGVHVSCKRRSKAGFSYSFFIQLFNVKVIFETVVFVCFRIESLF